jgi:hypothetical protein
MDPLLLDEIGIGEKVESLKDICACMNDENVDFSIEIRIYSMAY